jgi:hypothetical protein
MTLTPPLRKLVVSAHITFAIGWLGAVASFLALAIAGLNTQDTQIMNAAYLGMDLTALCYSSFEFCATYYGTYFVTWHAMGTFSTLLDNCQTFDNLPFHPNLSDTHAPN